MDSREIDDRRTTDAVARYRRPEYRRLLAAARRSLERTGGDLSRTVGVTEPDDAERNAIIGITGRHRSPGVRRVTVSLHELDAAVRGGSGLGLVELLEAIGPKLANRPAEAAREAAARRDALSVAYASPLYGAEGATGGDEDAEGDPDAAGGASGHADGRPTVETNPSGHAAENTGGEPNPSGERNPNRDASVSTTDVEGHTAGSTPDADGCRTGGAGWYRVWLDELSRDGTVTRLIGRDGAAADIRHAVRVLEHLESRPAGGAPVMLPALAAAVTNDTKALNHGTSLATLVLRALALRAGVPRPTTAEERRDLWDRFDVVVDDLASRVLVLNLPADGAGLGEWLTGAARTGTPFYVTLQQIVTLPVAVRAPVVHVCENPAILRRAAGELGARSSPLVCTEGRPSTAFRRLAGIVTAGGGRLRYHGDFDWPGVAIAADVIERHGASPWRMSAVDYWAGLGESGQHVALSGRPVATPWDPELERAMRERGMAVYEEAVGDVLLADLGSVEGG